MSSLFTPIALIIASIGLFIAFINPQYAQFQSLRDEAATYDGTLTQTKQFDAQWQSIINKNNAITQTQLDSLNKMLPDSVDTIRLIADINSIAASHGIVITNIGISGNDTTDNSGTQTIGPSNTKYGVLKLAFGFSAPYQNFIGFLDALEHSLRIIDVTGLNLKATKPNSYDYSVNAQTYWLK